MAIQSRFIRYLLNSLIYVVVSVLVLAAIGLTLARIYLPTASEYKDDIERWVSEVLKQEVQINSLSADWHGLEPQLVLEQVRFFDKDRTVVIANFERARIGINILGSIRRMAPIPGTLVVEGAHLILVRDKAGNMSVEGFETPRRSENATSAGQLLTDWLLTQSFLKLERCSVVWRDEQDDRVFAFSDLSLTIRNRGTEHQVDGVIALPSELGSQLVFYADVRGDVLSSDTWSGNVYVTGVGIQMRNWLKNREYGNLVLDDAVAGFNVWTRWQSAKLEEARGGVVINDLTFKSASSAQLMKVNSLASDVAVQRRDNIWQVTADQLTLTHRDRTWPTSRLDVRFNQATGRVDAEASYVNVDDVAQFLMLGKFGGDGVQSFLRSTRPSGSLENLSLFLGRNADDQMQIASSARFRNVSLQPWKKFPGFRSLSGEFDVSNHDGVVYLDTSRWRLDHPRMFRGQPGYDYLTGQVRWYRNEKGLIVEGNDLRASDGNASAKGRFRVDVEKDKAPFLDLVLDIRGRDGSRIGKYLPANIMKPKVVSWIEEGVKGGSIRGGSLVYYGYVNEFPFLEGNGVYNVNVDIADAELKFLPDWPAIRDISGELDLSGRGLRFTARGAKIFHNDLENVSVAIEDFKADNVMLDIAGMVKGPTNDKLRFLHESPLEEIFAKHLQPFDAEGNSNLDLSLQIPLTKGAALSVNGVVAIEDNRFYSEALKLDFTNLNTDIRFDERGISSQRIQADLGPIKIDSQALTVEDAGERRIIFDQALHVDQNVLGYVFENFVARPHWTEYISGETDAHVYFVIPTKTQAREPVTLQVVSDTAGLGVSLPEPLYKEPGESRSLIFTAELSGDTRQMLIDLERLNVLLQFASAGKQVRLERGGVGFDMPATLPVENGFQFNGKLERFNWSEWQPLFFPPEGKTPLLGKSGGGPSSVFFDVNVDQVEIFGAQFNQVGLHVSNTSQSWIMHANGPDITGSVYMPVVWKSAPLVMDMEKLHIRLAGGERKGTVLDPRDLPEAKIKSKEFSFNGMNFGELDLDAVRAPSGLHLRKMKTNSKSAQIEAEGDWLTRSDFQFSDFRIKVKTRNFGGALSDWGYKNVFVAGVGEINMKVKWPGSPADFTVEKLTGALELNVNKTQLVNLDVGALKMFNLFSVESLPRRLAFDFSDVTTKGVSFDNLIGKFDIQNGDAFTSGTILTGPTARMQMAGRVGLAKQDYDLVVTFIPRAFESLPVIGALTATTGPVTGIPLGATLYVLQKVFQKQVDELTAVQYTVTGDWKKPNLKKFSNNIVRPPEFFDE